MNNKRIIPSDNKYTVNFLLIVDFIFRKVFPNELINIFFADLLVQKPCKTK